MPVDIRFSSPNTPGTIATAARALADAGVNIDGMGCDIRPGEGWGFIHFLVEDAEAAKQVLEDKGFEILDIHDVDVVQVEDRPGALAEICESYAERGENIEVLYAGSGTTIVVGTENMRRPFKGRTTADTSYTDTRLPQDAESDN